MNAVNTKLAIAKLNFLLTERNYKKKKNISNETKIQIINVYELSITCAVCRCRKRTAENREENTDILPGKCLQATRTLGRVSLREDNSSRGRRKQRLSYLQTLKNAPSWRETTYLDFLMTTGKRTDLRHIIAGVCTRQGKEE